MSCPKAKLLAGSMMCPCHGIERGAAIRKHRAYVPKPRRRPLAEDYASEVGFLIECGVPIADVARRLGIDRYTVKACIGRRRQVAA